MERGRIEAAKRSERGRRPSRRLRQEGRIPAVLYGRGAECIALTLEAKPLEGVLRSHRHLVEVDVEGRSEPALVQEIQWDPLGEHIEHVDFLRISLEDEVEIEVDLHTVGQAKGLKEGGVLEQHASRLRLKALPHLVPEVLRIDVSALELGQQFTAGDVDLPSGVRLVGDAATPLVSVVARVESAEEAAEGEEAPTEPEVIKKGGKTEEADDAEAES